MKNSYDHSLLLLPAGLIGLWGYRAFSEAVFTDRLLAVGILAMTAILAGIIVFYIFAPSEKENRKRLERIKKIPEVLLTHANDTVTIGHEIDLDEKIYLPDSIRARHVHILGATGSGKTESVILNFLRQDVQRGLGTIVLDAKGDISFLETLENSVPNNRLQVFDLSGGCESISFNPLKNGSPLESAQRLFSSLTWSEEYYKSKALSTLQTLFQNHYEIHGTNPSLMDVARYLESPEAYNSFIARNSLPASATLKEYQDLSGLRDQVRSLTLGHLSDLLSPPSNIGIDLTDASAGNVIYFRLQSLMSPQIVAVVGRLLINNLNFLAGSAHRERGHGKQSKLVPIYLDEFASFACPEFADLISKARSAGFALHFSHQSIGDLTEVSPGFLNRITDNSATKIVLRINDPDSAEFFARSFGTKEIQKATQRVTNAKEIEAAEIVGEGTIRDAHQFRASPDLFKTLPTGTGAVLIAHGLETEDGASNVFRLRFPRLEKTIL